MKIDFVIAWVDGNDEKWLLEKSKYSLVKENDQSKIRYRDWENLKYLFRGIEKYAPWVNNVFFITYGHLPSWLNVNNDKLKIIKHSDYIPEEYLPTFSANPIELNFHKIKDLSENFVYFNDDMFITDYVKEEDFFKNGLPCETAILNPVTPSGLDVMDYIFFNNTRIINKHFDKKICLKNNFFKFFNYKYGKSVLRTCMCCNWRKFLGFKFTHFPTSLKKSTYEAIWNLEYEALHEACKNKFRSKDDYSQYLMKDWQIASGNFFPRSLKIGKFHNVSDDLKEIKKDIESNNYKLMCINDKEFDGDFEVVKNEINSSFEKILGNKSSFEK